MSKSSAPMRERKSFTLQVKTFDDAAGRITGYLSTFDNIDEGGDRVRHGAFKRTLAYKYAYKTKNNKRYLMPLLWQHDVNQPIGGYLDLKEDTTGLWFDLEIDLDIQKGQEAYSGLKKQYIFQSSMGYDCLQSEYIKVDGDLVRDLLEVRLWEGSIVTFPMNTEAVVASVKSVCGSTDLPIGARDDSWDGSKAHKQIIDWATKSDGSLDPAKMAEVHLQVDGDDDKITSYGYAFCYIVDGSPQISVAGVKACAAALSGARGADAGEDTKGMQAKVATLYDQINKKYPDDPQLTPPWEDKGKAMTTNAPQKKTLMQHYAEEMCKDLLEDWQDVYVCALTSAILDALKIGDQPAEDISQALDDFKELVLSKFVTQAVECNLSGYLSENAYSPADYSMQYGSESKPDYGWMATSHRRSRKAGRSFSLANAQAIQEKADALHGLATKALTDMKEHTKAVHSAADDLATIVQGSEPAYGTDPGTPDEDQQEGKSKEKHYAQALDELRKLRTT